MDTELKTAIDNNDGPGATSALARGANPNAMYDSHCTMLGAAVDKSAGNDEVVRAILRSGADPEKGVVGEYKIPPLVWAARYGHLALCRLLLEYGADAEATDSDGMTGIYEAAERGHREVIQLLVSHGCDPQQADNGSDTPAEAARRCGYTSLGAWLQGQVKLTIRPIRVAKEISDGEFYPNRSGLVVFFNFPNVTGLSPIPGAHLDEQNIKNTFGCKLGYVVETHTDLTAPQTSLELERLAGQKRLWHLDALIIIISTHGGRNTRFRTADNQDHDLREVRQYFSSKNCRQMINKPFLLIADFCRGHDIEAVDKSSVEDGTKALSVSNTSQRNASGRVVAPRLRDMATIYASSEGVTSRASVSEGSWFISALCETLDDNPHKELESIMFLTSQTLEKKGRPHPVTAKENPFGKFVFQIKKTNNWWNIF